MATKPKEEPTANAVVVTREFGEDGNLNIDVSVIGDVKPTEAETLLRLGIRVIQGRLGLND
jgi:hypothetical protein